MPPGHVSNLQARSTMRHVTRMALMVGVGVAVAALWAVSGDRGYGQADDANAAPNPCKMQYNWLQVRPRQHLFLGCQTASQTRLACGRRSAPPTGTFRPIHLKLDRSINLARSAPFPAGEASSTGVRFRTSHGQRQKRRRTSPTG